MIHTHPHNGHQAELWPSDGWWWWRCDCGAQSGPPFYEDAATATTEWATHAEEANPS